MSRTFVSVLVLVALSAAAPTMTVRAAASDSSPRYIEAYTGPDSAYEIDRGASHLAPHLGLTLRTGDCVVVRQPTNSQAGDNANRMTLMIDGTEVRVDGDHPKYCVVPAAATANAAGVAIARMFESIGSLFARSQNDYYTEHTAAAQTRGGAQEPVLIYLLQAPHVKIASGTRTLAVAWIDGKAPFDAKVFADGAAALLASQTALQSRNARLSANFAPGKYRLQVTDANGAHVTAPFEAVAASTLPAPSARDAAALANTSQPLALRRTLYAAWLANQGADWRFEAYQHVVDFAATSDLARALSFELAGG